ncbi:MAG: MBOAT family protein [Lentisphaerae bacterium]|nr:MBOAT family protein [Lentisphaerota bacterium]
MLFPTLWKPFILAASYFFYGWWDWRFLGLIIACTVTSHAACLGMARYDAYPRIRRLALILALLVNLGILGFFKYYGFFTVSIYQICAQFQIPCSLPLLDIVLPVGISFFTFQAVSYVMDVYRREMAPAKHLLDFAVYLAFFPQLVAGPIVRAKDLLPQVVQLPTRGSILDTGRAMALILTGLFKKMVIANYLASHIADPVFAHPSAYGGWDVLIAVYGYAMQIYCDFSAYSDIAIGLGLLLGFDIMINFNAPYFATSIQSFWRRWHISLSTFLRDYLYIPLGGSRCSEPAVYRNLMITFLLGGLWHGAGWTFIIWGALHGVYLSMERVTRRLLGRADVSAKRPSSFWGDTMRRVWVFQLICFSWIFFRSETFHDALIMLSRFGHWTAPDLVTFPVILAMGIGFALQFLDGSRAQGLWNLLLKTPPVAQGLIAAIALLVIQLLGPEGMAPFIYFQF